MDYLCETVGLTKSYKTGLGLDNVSIQLERGKIYGLVGVIGSGKTTLMRILAGLVLPTSGSFTLHGRAGFLFERAVGYDTLTLAQNLAVSQKIRGSGGKDRVNGISERAGLQRDEMYKIYRNTSEATKKRYGVALALLSDPELMVLDEPFAGMDSSGVRDFQKVLRELQHSTGVTMLVSAHNLSSVYRLATDFIFLHNGRVIQLMTYNELVSRCGQTLELRTNRPDDTYVFLQRKLSAEAFKRNEDGSFTIYALDIKQETVNDWMYQQGIIVESLEQKGKSIDDFFLELTRGGARYV